MSIYFLNERPASAIADWDTNPSFVKVAQHLKDKGIKNHDFMILLLDPDLKGVDPFDPNLSDLMKVKISIEARDNPFYFVRSCTRVQKPDYTGHVPSIGDLSSIAFWWLYGIGGFTIAREQIRQSRKNWNALTLMNWLGIFSLQPEMVYVLNKDHTLARHSAQSFTDQDTPDYIKLKGLYLEETTDDNYTSAVVGSESSRFKIMFEPAQVSEKRAQNQGRGMTTAHVFINDAAWVRHIETYIRTLYPATHAARKVAVTQNRPNGFVINTSAGKKNTPEGKFIYDLISKFTDWDDSLYDLDNKEQLHFTTRSNVRIQGTYDRVGLTYDEVIYQAHLAGVDPNSDLGQREYFNHWTE